MLEGSPSVAPQVSTASTGNGVNVGGDWKVYFKRTGLPAALKVLAGLCRGHAGAQGLLSNRGLLEKLHWMEGTSTSGEVSHHCLMGCIVGGVFSHSPCFSVIGDRLQVLFVSVF